MIRYYRIRLNLPASTLIWDNTNPRIGADHAVDFDWSRRSRDFPDVSAK